MKPIYLKVLKNPPKDKLDEIHKYIKIHLKIHF